MRHESEAREVKFTCTYGDGDSRARSRKIYLARDTSRTFTPCERMYVNSLIILPIKYVFSARCLVLKGRDVSCHHALTLICRFYSLFFFLCI